MRAGNSGVCMWGAHVCASGKAMTPLPDPFLGNSPPLWLRKEDVKNEVAIMNQLSHVNLIQLYDAFEGKNSFTLVME